MKKILFSLIAMLSCMSMSAQKIIIYQGGEVYGSYSVDEVDSIVYTTSANQGGGDAGGDSVDPNSWTVMFYSVGGGNLDTAQVQNISQAMRSQVNSNINMTFEFKFSKELQSKVANNQQGTFFFDMAAVRNELGTSASTYDDGGKWMANITTEKIGEASYDMSKASNLTTFINKSIAVHPAAHYMLILSDHGSGWNALKDNVVNAAKGASITGILADDNNDAELSAASVEQAIKNSSIASKKVDAIYCDACLMATAENIYQYSSVASYFIGAVELTPGMGGEYTKLLDYIGANSDAWTWGQNYVNYLTSAQHWGQEDDSKTADLGIYNLTKMCDKGSDLTNAILNFAAELKNGLTDATNAKKINSAVVNTQIAQSDSYGGFEYTDNTFPGLTGSEGKLTVQALRNYYNNNKDNFVSTYKANPSTINQLLTDAVASGACGLILADFMAKIVEQFGTNSAYNVYYLAYLAALKNYAYIRSALKPSDADFAYQHVSMSVNIYGMNSTALASWNTNNVTWIDSNGDIVGNESQMAGKSADDLQNAYKSTTFDQQTNWCTYFLSNLMVNPGPFFNRSLESMNIQ